MHIQLLTGFISGFFHISGQHRFVGERASGSYPDFSLHLGNMGSLVREPPVLWAVGGVRADVLRPGEEGNRRFHQSAGCEKSGF